MNIVDTGSKDRSKEIARDWGARVLQMPWIDDFSAARNASLAACRGRYITWKDCDDEGVLEVACRYRKLAAAFPEGNVAFYEDVRIPGADGSFDECIARHVKMFPNRPDLRFTHRIHEQILPALKDAGIPVLDEGLYVIHRNYDRSPEGQAKKRIRDFRLLELDLRDHPRHPFPIFNWGMTCRQALGTGRVAAQFLERAIELGGPDDSIVPPAYALLGDSLWRSGHSSEALAANERGRFFHPDDAHLLYQAGEYYETFRRPDRARESLERLVNGKDNPRFPASHPGHRTYMGWTALAVLYRSLGDLPHAESVLRDVLAAHPEYHPARLELAATLAGSGRGKEAAELVSAVPESEALLPWLRVVRRMIAGQPPPSSLPWAS